MSRVAFVNGLTAEENERLALLSEECAEVIQVIGKIQRHGLESTNPDDATPVTNRELLAKELGDVSAALCLLRHKGDVSMAAIESAQRSKLHRLKFWLHMDGNLEAVHKLTGVDLAGGNQGATEVSVAPSASASAIKEGH